MRIHENGFSFFGGAQRGTAAAGQALIFPYVTEWHAKGHFTILARRRVTIESEIALLIMSGQRVERDVYTLIMVGGERERLVRNFSNILYNTFLVRSSQRNGTVGLMRGWWLIREGRDA